MKNITDYIFDNFNTPDNVDDVISFITPRGKEDREILLDLNWQDCTAKPFFCDVRKMDIAMGENGSTTHYDIVQKNIDGCDEKTGLNTTNYRTRRQKWDRKPIAQKEFWRIFPEMKNVRPGRLWDLRDNGIPVIVIGYWDNMTSDEWYKCTDAVVEYYSKKFSIQWDNANTGIVGINNNGNLFCVLPKGKRVKISGRTKKSQELYGIAKAIHLANQKDKERFYAAFRKNRDEKNQQIYNHTPSKTEAEWRSLRYQESLEE